MVGDLIITVIVTIGEIFDPTPISGPVGQIRDGDSAGEVIGGVVVGAIPGPSPARITRKVDGIVEVIHESSRRRAIDRGQEHAQIPRKRREDIPFSEINDSSRDRNSVEIQRQRTTHAGRRNTENHKNCIEDHPDGHPDQIDGKDPPWHTGPHIHAKDRDGNVLIITYPELVPLQ